MIINALNKGATLLIFDQDLNPSQVKAIGELTEIIGPTAHNLILDIFAAARPQQGREGSG